MRNLKWLFYLLLCITICSVQSGCHYIAEKEKPESVESSPVESLSANQSADTYTKMDEAWYLNKIWVSVVYDHDDDVIRENRTIICSFYISDISDGRIEGRIRVNEEAFRDYYTDVSTNEIERAPYMGYFSGKLEDKTAKCEFYDGCHNQGKMTLTFQEEDSIAVTFDVEQPYVSPYDIANERGVATFYSGTYEFNPWKLQDVEKLILNEKVSLKGELENMGQVCLKAGTECYGKHNYPCAYLTDADDNILQKLDLGNLPDWEIANTELNDINGDGLMDIGIETVNSENPNIQGIQWIFYQQEDGMFARQKIDKTEQQTDKIDYSQYYNKIWIYDEGINDEASYSDCISISILQVKDGHIEGRYEAYAHGFSKQAFDVNTPYYGEDGSYPKNSVISGYFEGEIIDGIAYCKGYYEWGFDIKVVFQITGWEDDKLNLSVEWIDNEEKKDTNFALIPQNVYDEFEAEIASGSERALEEIKELSCKLELEYWGEVMFIPIKETNTKRGNWGFFAYLTNLNGDVLCRFNFYASDFHDSEQQYMADVEVEDFNGDGLQDIRISSFFPSQDIIAGLPIPIREWTYYQLDGDMFIYEFKEIEGVDYSSLKISDFIDASEWERTE